MTDPKKPIDLDIAFDDLQDPYGKSMWPEFKGRDGCRTPMVWESDAPNGGFSTARPWLPVPPEHKARAVDRQQGQAGSMLEHYRRFLEFRRAHPALAKGDIEFLAADDDVLVFTREHGNEQLVCSFNLGPRNASVDLGGDVALQPVDGHGFASGSDAGKIKLGAYGAWFGRFA